MDQTKASIDEKGRITIPQDLRNKLGLTPGTNINFSVINKILLIKKLISPDEFTEISNKIGKVLEETTNSPIEFEKLF